MDKNYLCFTDYLRRSKRNGGQVDSVIVRSNGVLKKEEGEVGIYKRG